MLIRQAYEEDSERRQLALPLAVYHLDDAVIPLHWHRELEFWLAGDRGVLEVEGKALAYQPGDLLFVNQQMLHRTPAAIRAVDILVFDLRILLSPLLSQSDTLFLNRLETGALLLPGRIGPDSPLYAPLASGLTESCPAGPGASEGLGMAAAAASDGDAAVPVAGRCAGPRRCGLPRHAIRRGQGQHPLDAPQL